MKKFPFYTKLERNDNNPACIRMIAKYYGKHFVMSKLRNMFGQTEKDELLAMSNVAEKLHFRTNISRLTWKQFCKEAVLPCIINYKFKHNVVVYKISQKSSFPFLAKKITIHVADPSIGKLRVNENDFVRRYCDIQNYVPRLSVLTLEPKPDFYLHKNEINEKLSLKYFIKYLVPHKKFLIQLILSIVVGTIISMIFPFMTQAVVDYGINNNDLNFVLMVLMTNLFLTVGQTANGMIRSWLMLHITTRMSMSLLIDYLIKIFNLPIIFFTRKTIGDIMQRMQDHERIRSFLTGPLIGFMFSIFNFVIYFIIMATYNLNLLFIFLGFTAVNTLWVLSFMKKRKELDYRRFEESSSNKNSIIQLLEGANDIKMNNCEKTRRWHWERISARLFKISIDSLILKQVQGTGSFFINQSKNIVISYVTAKSVIKGDMTLGMMMAVSYILGQLNGPIKQFIGYAFAWQDAKISMERLGEIHNEDNEETNVESKITQIPKGSDIVISNLNFKYNELDKEMVLKNINLKVPANKVTAIIGTSGSGKTTLIKLMLSYFEPNKGDIKINGIDLKHYSKSSWRDSCGVVLQDNYIFSDTVNNNIGFVDSVPDQTKVEDAAINANIKEFIEDLPLSYETQTGAGAQGLSSGQRQRMFIARALYKNPDYLFFDEATNNLDSRNERVIMNNLDDFFRNRTVVVVAHRLSTIKKADQIVVLEKGEVVEIGNHADLLNKKGSYYNLVKDQIELTR